MMRLISLVFVLASTAVALPGGLHAQILGQEGAAHQSKVHAPTGVSRTFGTQDEAVLTLTAWDFATASSTQTWGQLTVSGQGMFRFCASGSCTFQAGVHLPAGALLTRVQLDACDLSATEQATVRLIRGVSPGAMLDLIPSPPVGTGFSEMPGCHLLNGDIDDFIIDNATQYVTVSVFLSGGGPNIRFSAVRVFYRLQVSPAPAVATFSDVPPSHDFFRFIEALARSGITAGCGGGNFCPDAPLTRGQMAVFLSLGLGLHFAP
jgi:S-layer family protein